MNEKQAPIAAQILARLPIRAYWTANYDQLIERALREAGKTPDIKYTNEHLAMPPL